jgi:hypothetical protein
MADPALDAEVMSTDIVVDGDFLAAANLTSADHSSIEMVRTAQVGLETRLPQILLVVVIVFLAKVFLIPLELPQQDETPSLVQVNQSLDLFQD